MASYPEELWHAVADLSGLLLSEEDLERTLRRVSDLAVRSIPSCDAVGVTLVEEGGCQTRAATGGLVYEIDRYQYDIDEGPCLQAVQDRRPHAIDDMASSTQWNRFARHAAERGMHSSLSLPLIVRGESLGALNLYSRRSGSFDAADRETALMFAAQAAVALANAQTYAAGVRLADQLRQAMVSRATIDQAIGAVSALLHCDADEAFDRIRATSQTSHRKLRVVADDILDAARAGRELPLT